MKKSITSIILCVVLGVTIGVSGTGISQASVIKMGNVSNVKGSAKTEKQLLEEAASLPSKFDLRDVNGKNYVTQVKLQNPFGTCWGFSITAACETSILYENGTSADDFVKINGFPLDLSEKALAWYSNHGITKEDVREGVVPTSQIGEGVDISESEKTYPNACYDEGGTAFLGTSVLSAAMGPKLENTRFEGEENEYPYAYRGKNGWTDYDMFVTSDYTRELIYKALFNMYRPYYPEYTDAKYEEAFKEYIFPALEATALESGTGEGEAYSAADDWSIPVDFDHRFGENAALLQNGNILPPTYRVDKNGNYVYDPLGVASIKKELVNGRAVSIAFCASLSRPNQIDPDSNYLSENWAQYTYKHMSANHCVTIVGYDDNYSRSNFLHGKDPETGEDMTPPGDGAFIVENSWGSLNDKTEGKHNYNDWGIDGSGYFYLSYYDKSLAEAESFDFYTHKEMTDSNNLTFHVDQYDFMPGLMLFTIYDSKPSSMANVFKAAGDQKLNRISVMTGMYNSKITYEIYKLKKGYKNPKDGKLLEKGSKQFEFGGYHSIELKGQYPMAAGTEYSVVVTNEVEISTGKGSEKSYETVVNAANTYSNWMYAFYTNAVVNRGESILYRDGSWLDWSDVSAVTANTAVSLEGNYYSFDNFSIKAFSIPATKDEVGTKNTIKLDGKSIMKARSFHVKKAKAASGSVSFKATRKGTGKITMDNKSPKKLRKFLSFKSGKVILKKGVPAGKYQFTLTVAAKGKWHETTSGVVTIVVQG